MLRFLTAGESHTEALVAILENFPKGVTIDNKKVNSELARRQSGYGRGGRMKIEKDTAHFITGLRNGKTLGSPIAFTIANKDKTISRFGKDGLEQLTVPRPAHADLAGALKYGDKDIRNMLERASARNTAQQVAVGSVCKQLLENFGYKVSSRIVELGSVKEGIKDFDTAMKKEIDKAGKRGDTLGGIIEIVAEGVVPGLGSFMHWDRRLDAKLAAAMMGIQAIKGVEIGLGFDYARVSGSKSHDVIKHSRAKGYTHVTNNSGGIEGGISNGEPIVIRIAMKPIATLKAGLESVDLKTGKKAKAPAVRSDVTAVTACGVIAEAMTSFVIADLFLEKFSSDTLIDIKKNFNSYTKRII